MKGRRISRTRRLSIRAAVTVALTALGVAAFAASADATFTLTTGALKLTNGTSTGTPPSGSWVELLSKDLGGSPFENPASGAENKDYTLILGSGATGLLLGKAQPNGGIFGPLTFFGSKSEGELFSANTIAGSQPLLTFEGGASSKGTRALTGGNLNGLMIAYAGSLYNIETQFNKTKDIVIPLAGTITGASGSEPTILLTWSTSLLEPGFSLFNALFHWQGTYIQ
jgi:hypothetical protein